MQADKVLVDSQKLLDDKNIFGLMRGVVLSDYNQNWTKFLVKQMHKKCWVIDVFWLHIESICSLFSEDNEDDDFTLGEELCSSWTKQKTE